MMKKIAGVLAALLLFMALSSCSGPFVDPGRAGMTGNGIGGGFGYDDDHDYDYDYDDDDDYYYGGNSGQVQSNYQGTYNVYGYYHNFNEELILWSSLTGSSYNTLKASCPTRIVLSSNSASCTGGMYNGKSFSARTIGSTLYVTIAGSETELGTFNSGDFRMTYGLEFASWGAYVLYKK